jgi:hypothetical protein
MARQQPNYLTVDNVSLGAFDRQKATLPLSANAGYCAICLERPQRVETRNSD